MFESIRGGLRALFHRRETEREFDDEVQQYIEHAVEKHMQSGMSRDQALRRARADFGSTEAVKDYVRDAGWESMVDSVWADLRFAARMMRKSPGFTAIVVVTLALGIGANTALFTVINSVLLKPMPVRDPNGLVLMEWDWTDPNMNMAHNYDGSATSDDSPTGNLQGTSFPYLTYGRMRAQKDTFESVFAFCPIEQLNVIADGTAEVAAGQMVTGDYYGGMGVQPWRGRLLTEADDQPGAPPAAVISWRYWQRRFGGETSAVGKVVTINDVKFTIVGVTPPGFEGALELVESASVSIPVQTNPLVHPGNSEVQNVGLWWLRVMARLQPGVSRTQAQARMDSIFQKSVMDAWEQGTSAGHVTSPAPTVYPHLVLAPGAQGDEFARRRYRQPLALLMGVVGLVLLIACINVANLLLARSSARQQEFSMRVALGASRWRLVRQLLTESLLMAAMAGAVGSFAAIWSKDLLLRWSAWIRNGAALDAKIDMRVLAFTFAISALTGILFGLAPAMRAGGTQLAPGVKLQIGNAGRTRALAGRLLIVAQVAVSLVLLVSATLFLRTLRNLHMVETGFNVKNVLLFRVKPETNGYTSATVGPLYDRMIERIGSIPGVTGVSLSRHPLLSGSHRVLRVFIKPGDPNNGQRAEVNVVSPSFMDTMGIPLVIGRGLRTSDTATATHVVVVNQKFVEKYLPGLNPIGQHFYLGGGGEGRGNPKTQRDMPRPNDNVLEIVGIARDAKYTGLRQEVTPTVYQPYEQSPSTQAAFEVRYSGNAAALTPAVRQAVQQVDPRLPIFELRTQAEQTEVSVGEETMFANLSSTMGALTLLLAAVGLYGIMSYTVGKRTREIGVRMALGAQQSAVMGMVLRESLLLVAIGLVAGIPIALASARAASTVLEDLLYGVKPTDPLSIAIAIAVMVGVAAFSGYFPARRASRTDPMNALRCE